MHFAIGDRNSISPLKLCVPICSTVGTLKQQLLRCSHDFQKISLYDMLGRCLKNDAQPLSEISLYAHQNCKLICLKQYEKDADNAGIQKAKLEAVLGLSSRWSAIAVGEQPAQLARNLHQSIESVLSSIDSDHDHLEAPLESSTYSCAGLPRPEPPRQGASPELETAKARFASLLAPANSECPAHATALLSTLANELGGFSPDLAGQCAGAVQSLLEPVEFLASRAPREHRHAAHRDNIRESRDALDLHRAIRADTLPQYSGSENMEAMLSAREATELVRSITRPAPRAAFRGARGAHLDAAFHRVEKRGKVLRGAGRVCTRGRGRDSDARVAGGEAGRVAGERQWLGAAGAVRAALPLLNGDRREGGCG